MTTSKAAPPLAVDIIRAWMTADLSPFALHLRTPSTYIEVPHPTDTSTAIFAGDGSLQDSNSVGAGRSDCGVGRSDGGVGRSGRWGRRGFGGAADGVAGAAADDGAGKGGADDGGAKAEDAGNGEANVDAEGRDAAAGVVGGDVSGSPPLTEVITNWLPSFAANHSTGVSSFSIASAEM